MNSFLKFNKFKKIDFKKFISMYLMVCILSINIFPAVTFAQTKNISSDQSLKNSFETIGTKANKLKTLGDSGVDEFSGAFTYSYPINIPPGRAEISPDITLSYNSQNYENSIFGYGWNLTLPYIERSSKNGIDKLYSEQNFLSSLGGEIILKKDSNSEYVQKIDDGSYQEYKFDSSKNLWTMKDRSGNVYTFGQTLDSRLSDENNIKVAKWYLTSTKDVLGNSINYFYEKKNNFVYPKEIVYTLDKSGIYSHKVVFEREIRSDSEISYKTGFRIEMKDRIKFIKIFTDQIETGNIEFKYSSGQNSSRSLLASIKENSLGTDNVWSSMPETNFEYSKYEKNISNGITLIDQNKNFARLDLNGDAKNENVDISLFGFDGAYKVPIDINGDYLVDMYTKIKTFDWYRGLYDSPNNNVLINSNGSFFETGKNLNIPTAYTWYNTDTYPGPYINVSNLFDLNADGLTDIFYQNNFLNQKEVYLNI
jgi:hypothetical protein